MGSFQRIQDVRCEEEQIHAEKLYIYPKSLLVIFDEFKEMNDLLQKEKKLDKEIQKDFKRISQKINAYFDKIRESKSLQ